MAFLEDCWYAAAWDDEIGEAPLARRILDRPVVLFRSEDGRAVALADRCVHRHLPLSHGRIEEGGIRCGYHGLKFASDGTCIEVPGQTKVPPGARVEAYPVVERDRFVWIWMGDPERADPALMPDYHWNDDPAWKSVQGRFHVAGDYRLIVDNLLDLSHVQFVHGGDAGHRPGRRVPGRGQPRRRPGPCRPLDHGRQAAGHVCAGRRDRLRR